MLRELKISNLAIIDKIDLEFEKGLIVLTGETGAGKSIILSGVNLLIGEKASVDMIRDGEDTLTAQGIFSINEDQKKEIEKLGIVIDDDDEIIIRRTYDIHGKGKAFINDNRVTLTGLKDIALTLIDIVGQHSHQMLLNKNNHIKLLDKFLDDEDKKIKERVKDYYKKYNEISEKINEIERNRKELLEKKDLYEFQSEEINKINPKIGEDIELEAEYKIKFNAGMIKDKLSGSSEGIHKGDRNILSGLRTVVKNLESISKYGEEYEEVLSRIEKLYYELEDCGDIILSLEENIEVDPLNLQKISDRLDAIVNLKLKYGESIEEILSYRDEIDKKLSEFDESKFAIETLLEEKKNIENLYLENAKELSERRKRRALVIEEKLKEELRDLKMENANFSIVFCKKENIHVDGIDEVEFFISTNLGQEKKPLSKIASGGEVSRIMLGLKVIFSVVDNIPVLVFDEIDTGVGGETIRKIASKLENIGNSTQIISITHSPIIASRASCQFYIKKEIIENKTVTSVSKLDNEGRLKEIARMLAGDNVTPSVLEHAKELLGKVEIKKSVNNVESNSEEAVIYKKTLF
ncbi:DNA repair protein RecN [Fusobacterium sp. PH5-44]|uniref:DNA repair protein RecN n=1 Tax=unclassified Fusobacterium TaxID=2648384 RepID=UPI003D1A1858